MKLLVCIYILMVLPLVIVLTMIRDLAQCLIHFLIPIKAIKAMINYKEGN